MKNAAATYAGAATATALDASTHTHTQTILCVSTDPSIREADVCVMNKDKKRKVGYCVYVCMCGCVLSPQKRETEANQWIDGSIPPHFSLTQYTHTHTHTHTHTQVVQQDPLAEKIDRAFLVREMEGVLTKEEVEGFHIGQAVRVCVCVCVCLCLCLCEGWGRALCVCGVYTSTSLYVYFHLLTHSHTHTHTRTGRPQIPLRTPIPPQAPHPPPKIQTQAYTHPHTHTYPHGLPPLHLGRVENDGVVLRCTLTRAPACVQGNGCCSPHHHQEGRGYV